MSNEYPDSKTNFGCSSDDKRTSSSSFSRDENTNKFTKHVINLKESKTHLFYLIQPDNENSENTPNLIRIKISKERPTSRNLVSKKMLLRYDSNDDVDLSDKSQTKIRKTPRPHLASIHKRTDHPSFYVLPEVLSKKRSIGSLKKKIDRNQSTSDNSNETYIVRSKEENQSFQSFAGKTIVNPKSEDYCECGKESVIKSKDQFNRDSSLPKFQQSKLQPIVSANNKSTIDPTNRISDELFKIKFVEPTQVDNSQRLRAGQDRESNYKSCYVCPNMTRIFPQTGSRRRSAPKSNYPDSNSSLKNSNGYVKINYKLVRHCLIYGSINEKCEVLDAIRLRMKSSDLNVATNTVEDIIRFDLFGVQCECRSKPLLEELFWPINVPTPYPLQTSIARFINALVSFKIGRSYFNNRSIVNSLTWGDIGRDNIDETMGDNLIGIMMKLSCNRSQWSDMIKNGLFHWLLTHMEEVEYSASKYHVTMMTGLLRNLLKGQNINDSSPIEIQKLIVLLGRYLDSENSSAKTYICDSLLQLFQKREIITAAKELNFPKVIEEHLMKAVNSKQKEHLRAVNHLLNGSGTSFNYRKIDSLTPEPFLDSDLEPNAATEIDYYPGESLLKDKFSGNEEVPCDKKNFSKFMKTNPEDKPKDGKLKSRVFVEHINCFLPEIEKNRIFPLCNARCADKIKTCTHIGDVQPKKRQPYIPPNSRTSRTSGLPRHISKQDLKWMIPVDTPWSQQSVDESIGTMSDEDNKSVILKSNPDSRLENSEQSKHYISRISTISHDKSAARWNNFEKRVETSVKSLCTDTNKVQRSFLKRSKTAGDVDEGKDIFSGSDIADKDLMFDEFTLDAKNEEILRCVSYHNQQSKSAEILNETKKQEKATSESVVLEELIPNRLSSKSDLHSPTKQNIVAGKEPSCDNLISSGGKRSETGTVMHIGQTDVTIIVKNNMSVTKSEGFSRMDKDHNLQNSKSVNAMKEGRDSSAQIEKIVGSKSDITSSVSRINRELISPDIKTKALGKGQESVPNTDSKSDYRLSGTRLNKEHDSIDIQSVDMLEKGQESLLNKDVTGSKSDPQSCGTRLNRERDSPDFKAAKAIGRESLQSTHLHKEHDPLKTYSEVALEKGQESLLIKEVTSKSDRQMPDTRLNQELDFKSAKVLVRGQDSLPNTSSRSDHHSSGTLLNKEHDSLFSESVDALERGRESLLNNISGSKSEGPKNRKDDSLNIKTKDALNRSQEISLSKEATGYKSDSRLSSNTTKEKSSEMTRHLSDISISRSKDMKNSIRSEIQPETSIPGVLSAAESGHQWSSSLPTTQSMQNFYEQRCSVDEVARFEEMLDKKSISGQNTNIQFLNARSEEVLSSKRNPKLSPDTTTGHQMHARSMEIIGRSKRVNELPTGALTKSKTETIRALQIDDDKELTAENKNLRNDASVKKNTSATKLERLETDQAKIDHELLSTNRVAIDSVLSTKQSKVKEETQELEQELHARSEEVLGNRKKERELLQCSISEHNKIVTGTSSKHKSVNVKPEQDSTAKNEVKKTQLHARSVETLKQDQQLSTSQSDGLIETSKTGEDISVVEKDKDRQHKFDRKDATSKEVLLDSNTSQKIFKEPKENLNKIESKNQLNARSEEVLRSKRNLNLSRGHTAKEIPINKMTIPHQLHARSAEILQSTTEIRESSQTELTKSNWKNTSKLSDDVVGSNSRLKNISGQMDETTIDQIVDTSKGQTVAEKTTRKINNEDQCTLTDDVLKSKTLAGKGTDELLEAKRHMFTGEVSKSGAVAEKGSHESLDGERQMFADELTCKRGNDFDLRGETEGHNIIATPVSNEDPFLEMAEKSPNRTYHQKLSTPASRTAVVLEDDVEKFNSGNEGRINETLPTSKERSNTFPSKAKLMFEDETDQAVSRRNSLDMIHSVENNDQSRRTKSLEEVTADVSVLLPSSELKEKIVYKTMLPKPNKEITEPLTDIQSDCQLLKPTSEDILKSPEQPAVTDNSIREMTHLLFARSEEIEMRRGKSSQHTESINYESTARLPQDKNQIAGLTSGYSSDSSMNKSRDCVDCEGTGTVLRARASQPCENCKTSLSKYRKFVQVLNNEVSPSEDDQQRVVTRTSDEAIKVSWINKSEEAVTTNKEPDRKKEDKGDDGKLDEKKRSGDLNRDTDAGDAAKSKGNTTNEEGKRGLSENEREDTTTEKYGQNQPQVNKSEQLPPDDDQGKSSKDVDATISITDQVSQCSILKKQPLDYLESGSMVTPQLSDTKEKTSMSNAGHEIVVSSGEIKNVSPKLSDHATSGVKNEVSSALSKFLETENDTSRDNLMKTKKIDRADHSHEGMTTSRETSTKGADNDGIRQSGELTADELKIQKDKGEKTSQKQSSSLDKKVRRSKSDKPINNTTKSLVEPLRGLSLDITLNTSRINKHLSFGAVRQTEDIEKPKFVENIIGETVTSANGNECLQTSTIRKSTTIGVEESVNNDLFDAVKISEEKADGIETKLLSTVHQDLNTSMDKISAKKGLSVRSSDVLPPRSIEIITDKVLPGPDNVLESIKQEERDIYSSHDMEEQFVETKSEQCPIVPLRKSNEQTVELDASNDPITTFPMEYLEIPRKLSHDVSANLIEEFKETEVSAVENELPEEKRSNKPITEPINKERDEYSSQDSVEKLNEGKLDQYPLSSIKKSNEQTVDATKALTSNITTSLVEKLTKGETNARENDLPDKFKGTKGTQSNTETDRTQVPVSLEIKTDNIVLLNTPEMQTDMKISKIDKNEHLSISLLKQSENVADTTRIESSQYCPTPSPVSLLNTSNEHAGTSYVFGKPNTSFEKRSNNEISHSLLVPLVLNSKETVSCVRGYQSLSEEELTTEKNVSEGSVNRLFVHPELIEQSGGLAESSQNLSTVLTEIVEKETTENNLHLLQQHLVNSQNTSLIEKFDDEKLEDNHNVSQTELVKDTERIQSTTQKPTGEMKDVAMSRSISTQFLTEFPTNHSNPQDVVIMFARSIEVVTDKNFNRRMTKREWKGGAKHSENVADKIENSSSKVSRRTSKNITVISMSNSSKTSVSDVKSDQSDIPKISEKITEEKISSFVEKSGECKVTNLIEENMIAGLKEPITNDTTVEQSRQSNDPIIQQSQTYNQPSNYLASKSTDCSNAGVNCDPMDKMKSEQPVDSESKMVEVLSVPCSQNVPKSDDEQPGLAQKYPKANLTLTQMDETIANQLGAPQTSVAHQLSLNKFTQSLPENNRRSLSNSVKEGTHREVGVSRSMVIVDKSGQRSSSTKNLQTMGESNTRRQMRKCEQKSTETQSDHGIFHTVRTCDKVTVSLDETIAEQLEGQKSCGAAGGNILSPRSIEIMPASSPLRNRIQDEVDCLKTKEILSPLKVNVAKRETIADKHLRKETKSIVSQKDGSKISVVSTTVSFDEIMLGERILSSERPTEQSDRAGGTSMNQQLRDDNRFSNVQRGAKEKSKVRIINSSCWRKLLDNDELINRLSEKVLQKLLTEIHMCGPNCKSPCGGLNPYFNSKEDNNQNSE